MFVCWARSVKRPQHGAAVRIQTSYRHDWIEHPLHSM